jgi:hypothetical protein
MQTWLPTYRAFHRRSADGTFCSATIIAVNANAINPAANGNLFAHLIRRYRPLANGCLLVAFCRVAAFAVSRRRYLSWLIATPTICYPLPFPQLPVANRHSPPFLSWLLFCRG